MEGLHYPRPCGCKGIRTCLLCEERNADVNTCATAKHKTDLEDFWQYCHDCGKVQPPMKSQYVDCQARHKHQGFYLPGIQVIPEFLTSEEEAEMVLIIDQSPWKLSQSGRCKQDYGPKPNFKRRKVKLGGFTGLSSFIKPFVSRMTKLESLKNFVPVEQCHLEYTPERGSSIDLHFDDFWLWGNRLVTINLLSDTFLLLKYDENVEDVEHNSKTGSDFHCEISNIRVDSASDEVGNTLISIENHSAVAIDKSRLEESCRTLAIDPDLNRKESINNDLLINSKSDNSLSEVSGCRNYHKEKSKHLQTADEILIPLPRRSLVVLSEDARYKWKHAVPREAITSRRIAVTLRELASDFLPGGANETDGQKLLDVALSYDGSVVR